MSAEDWMSRSVRAVLTAKNNIEIDDPDAACNRSYYSMYYAACAALTAAGHPIGKTHKTVINTFSEKFVKTGMVPVELGQIFKASEYSRYVADYGDDGIDLALAQERVREAGVFVGAVRQMIAREYDRSRGEDVDLDR